MPGPLDGVRVIELGGLVAAPFCAMLLADMGADVVHVDRPGAAERESVGPRPSVSARGRRAVELDLKSPDGVEAVLKLADRADMLIESFRPGVAERLGVGPASCRARNPALVYGRLTGWGQTGPAALRAGHDVNYIAQAGLLAHMPGTDGRPVIPLNAVGDLAGGGMLLAMGMLAALHHIRSGGSGQVVDAAMMDGAALLTTTIAEYAADGWSLAPGQIPSDGGNPLYAVYACADGRYVSIACVEPQFEAELYRVLGLEGHPALAGSRHPQGWTALRDALAERFRSRDRAAWCALIEDNRQLCFAPVLTLDEAADHDLARARGTYLRVGGVIHPMPAPRFDGTPTHRPPEPERRQSITSVLTAWRDRAAHQKTTEQTT